MLVTDINTYVKDNVSADGVVMITVCRNELKRIPAWLDHYRALGVKTFIVIDNDSSDGTMDYLRTQRDVHGLSTTMSYRESKFGADWINAARRGLPHNSWTLYADMDEFLIYRGAPGRSIADLVANLGGDANAVFALMVDMYPKGSFLDVDPGDGLVETCCYFDSDYRFRKRPLKPWDKGRGELECLGGPRLRMMSNLEREARTTWLDYFFRAQLGRVLKATPPSWHRTIVANYPPQPPGLNKTPLTINRRAGVDNDYGNSHGVHDAIFAEETVVLLHFKFTSDLRDKVDAELLRKEHFRFGAEYMMYNNFIQDRRKLDLYVEGISRKFEGPASFDDLGLFDLKKHMNSL